MDGASHSLRPTITRIQPLGGSGQRSPGRLVSAVSPETPEKASLSVLPALIVMTGTRLYDWFVPSTATVKSSSTIPPARHALQTFHRHRAPLLRPSVAAKVF
ncbi:hypothetical protein HYQ46_012560 [Verticillium longisporum]|nr:hypothetical protein HYQ44_000103 [Verticillium longisporum]KAG7153146.1 hypothetical protein HYQ46_012560 [Verticillium longisporum]